MTGESWVFNVHILGGPTLQSKAYFEKFEALDAMMEFMKAIEGHDFVNIGKLMQLGETRIVNTRCIEYIEIGRVRE